SQDGPVASAVTNLPRSASALYPVSGQSFPTPTNNPEDALRGRDGRTCWRGRRVAAARRRFVQRSLRTRIGRVVLLHQGEIVRRCSGARESFLWHPQPVARTSGCDIGQ